MVVRKRKALDMTMAPDKLRDIQTCLRAHFDEMARDFGVSEIGVFGSYARGEEGPDSDVDILVSFARPIGFFRFLELEEQLSEWLGLRVDLVTKAALKPHIGERILDEVVML